VTTLVEVLRAIERGDPFATREAVDAIGIALEVLVELAADTHRSRDDDGGDGLEETRVEETRSRHQDHALDRLSSGLACDRKHRPRKVEQADAP
jgi:hypothetical protein